MASYVCRDLLAGAIVSTTWIASSNSGPTLFDRFVTWARSGPKRRRGNSKLGCVGFPSRFIRRHRPKVQRSRFVQKIGRRFAHDLKDWPSTLGFQLTRLNEM